MDLHRYVSEEHMSFPSYLHSLQEVKKLPKLRLKQTINRILPDISTYDSDMEIVRDYNLVAFFHFLLDQKEEAIEFIEKTLSKTPKNINGLVLKSWFYLQTHDLYESKSVLEHVNTLTENTTEMVFAKAELAYIYTRLGIQFYSIGENKYEELFKDVEEKNIYIEPHIYTNWKFGQGLIMKRLLNVNNLYEENTFDITFERLKHIFRHYKEIASKENIDNKLRARSYIEMGELIRSDLARDFPENSLFEHPQDYYFQEALALCDSDPFVLERCGRHFRYKDVEQSIELLKQSLSLRRSSYAHHHLALAIKRKLLFYQRSKSPSQRISNVRRRSTSNRPLYARQHSSWSRGKQPSFHQKERLSFSLASSDSGFQSIELPSTHGEGYDTFHFPANNVYSEGAVGGSTRDYDQYGQSEQHSSLITGFNAMSLADSYTQRKPRYSLQGRRGVRNNARSYSGTRRKHSRSDSNESNQGGGIHTGGANHWIKSPKTVECILEENTNTAEDILFHLDEAYDINGNIAALYDKGLTLRALRRHDAAIEIFKLFMGRVPSSLVYVANAYEQSALCLKEKMEKLPQGEKTKETLEKIRCNIQYFLNAFIEISYNKILVKCPGLMCTSTSVEMLKELLNEKERTKQNVQQLSDLYSRIQEYAKANEYLRELLQLENDTVKRHAIQMRLIKNHADQKHYDDAILSSELLGFSNTDNHLYREIHLEGGFQSYSKGELRLAKLRLQRALRQQVNCVNAGDDSDIELFDVFTLGSDSLETSSRNVAEGLKSLGLDVTFNFDDVGVFDPKSAVLNVMVKSTHFVVFVDFETDSDVSHMNHYLETIRAIRDERNYGNILFLTKNESTSIPASFRRFPRIVYDEEKVLALQDSPLPENSLNFLKEMLRRFVY